MAGKNKKSSGGTSAGKKSSGRSGYKSFLNFLRGVIVYSLALYGLHSMTGCWSSTYRKASDECIQKISRTISSQAKNAQEKIELQPTIVIRNADDLAKSKYDNLTLGVPTFACDVIIDRAGYALGYSEKYEQPLWVSYKLTAEEVKSKKAKRSGDFRSDPDIPGNSASPEDYKGSFFDRGHLAPAADMSFSLQAMSESFYMSNMSPQRPEFNRGIWKKLEAKVRDYAVANGAIYVISGPVFDPDTPAITIGSNKVAVPDKYYKVLLDPDSSDPKAIGFIFDNRDCKKPLQDYAVTIDMIEELTGLDFFNQLDPDDERTLESECNYLLWERSLPLKNDGKKKVKSSARRQKSKRRK